ncbi:MAG: trigger factor [bacterium]
MKVSVTDQQDQKKRLEFEIPQDIISKELDKVYRQFNSSAKIKGFRPGKVPKAILKRFYWTQIESEVIQGLVPTYYREAIVESALEPVGEPHFDEFFVEEGRPLTVGVTIEVKPLIEPRDYTKIEVKWRKPQATDADVEDMLARLRAKNANIEVVEDRPVEAGDIVLFSYSGTVSGTPLDTKKRQDGEIEVNGTNDFTKALIGVARGDTKRMEMTLPEDFPNPALQGKKAILDVTVREIKTKHLPALDDEFARDLGEYDDLESLKKEVREQIQASLDRQAENAARGDLVEVLLERNPFEPPESMVETRLDEMIAHIEDQLRMGGGAGNWDRAKVREELRPKAKKDVHLSLVQEGIARKEGLNVPEGEIEHQIEILSLQTRQDFESLKNKAKMNGTWDRIRAGLLREKAMDVVVESAVRSEIPERADEDNRQGQPSL